MDTTGRPTLHLTALNVVDDLRDSDLFVTYDLPWLATYRKPAAFAASILGLFATIWVVGSLDMRIGKK